jgi:hypothetical protein
MKKHEPWTRRDVLTLLVLLVVIGLGLIPPLLFSVTPR